MTDWTSFADTIDDTVYGMKGRQGEWVSPGELARDVEPYTRQTPALDLIDAALVDVDAGRCDRLMISMPPQEGKSTRVTKIGPTWMLIRNPERRIVVAAYGQDLANEFGRDIRGYIAGNQGGDGTLNLGISVAPDNGSVASWRLKGHRGGVRSVGVGGGLTGRPADVLFIDDPISNREQAESETYRERAKNWWTSTASTRLAPGAPVVLVLTRWHEDDLAGWLLNRPDGHRWRVINIPAQADHDPNAGQSDPLDREPGEYMRSARIDEATGRERSVEDWEQIKVQVGSRDWQALYQGHPSAPAGDMLKRDWWQRYTVDQWIEREDGSRVALGFDDLIQSWDMTFKDTSRADFVVGQVWGRRGADAYLLDQVRGRMDFPTTVQAFMQLTAKWPQAVLKIVEDKANGPAVISSLARVVPGIVPEEPTGSKTSRVAAVSPIVEAGNVWLPSPELAPWVGDFVEEAAGFPNAAHDDQVDAASQALNRLIVMPLTAGHELLEAEEYDVVDLRGFYASPI